MSMKLMHEAEAARTTATQAMAVYEQTKAASQRVRAEWRAALVKSAAMDAAFEAEVKAEFQAVKYALRADAAEMAWWDEA